MAQPMKKATKKTKDSMLTNIVEENITEEITDKVDDIVEIEEKVEEKKDEKKAKKVFKDTDLIRCVSITSGELGMTGIKTSIGYRWAGRGDETGVEYQDLVAAVRLNKNHIYKPYFIISDKDFIAQFPQVEKVYSSMFTYKDLTDVLKLEPERMRSAILSLPDGAKNSIKNIISSLISSGNLDSIARIKVLDEIFDTKFMLMTELYG